MWPFKRKVRQRRLEVRKHLPIRRRGWWQSFRQAGGIRSGLIALGLVVALVALDAATGPLPPYRSGQYVPADRLARVDFLSKKSIEQARKFTPAQFTLQPHRLEDVQQAVETLASAMDEADEQGRQELAQALGLPTDAEYEAFARRMAQVEADGFAADVARLDEVLAQVVLVDEQQAAVQRTRAAREVFLKAPDRRTRTSIQDLVPIQDPYLASRHVRMALNRSALFDRRIRNEITELILSTLRAKGPIWEYNAEATNQLIDQSIQALQSIPVERLPEYLRVQHLAGEVLVRASSKIYEPTAREAGLTRGEIELLRDEAQAFRAQERAVAPWRAHLRAIGRVGILVIVIALFAAYLAFYYPRVIENQWRALSLALVLVLGLGVSQLAVYGLEWDPHAGVFAVLMASIIAALVYDRRFALMFAALASALQVLLLRGGLDLGLVFFVASAVTIFQLNDVRTRTKLIRVAAVGGGAMAAGIWLIQLAQNVPWPFIFYSSLWGASAAVLVGFLAQGILPLVERVFRIATSMTLLEWCDASKPLLKRIAMEAPGTYNHSLQLGAMCEAAAESIGADGLRARVGAYYHDIGKIHKPDYFIENASGGDSKHAKLSPAMSLLIIIGHVKDGLELAREYNLPRVLHEFISSHHGTTLVQCFYQAATEKRKNGSSDRTPDEVEFRYPGPKPRSREAAILMLADAAESSVRSMSEPTPGRIENQVHTMVTRRMMDGQLDECHLTLLEVHQIEASLVKSLCSFYHSRIAYPTPEGEKPSAAEKNPRRDKASGRYNGKDKGEESQARDEAHAPAGHHQPASTGTP
jgi:putative nucleotidyltransferase with HDIG domain